MYVPGVFIHSFNKYLPIMPTMFYVVGTHWWIKLLNYLLKETITSNKNLKRYSNLYVTSAFPEKAQNFSRKKRWRKPRKWHIYETFRYYLFLIQLFPKTTFFHQYQLISEDSLKKDEVAYPRSHIYSMPRATKKTRLPIPRSVLFLLH